MLCFFVCAYQAAAICIVTVSDGLQEVRSWWYVSQEMVVCQSGTVSMSVRSWWYVSQELVVCQSGAAGMVPGRAV